MPRYFFDLVDDGRVVPDEEGTELVSLDEAREEALITLAGIAKDSVPEADRRELLLRIREGDEECLTARFLIEVQHWEGR